mmetsp:Transcript_89314/g.237400  ORF Transcript_89314/g.237400 Transcript_89314/m.237400 type:complete len:209 (+) Transcript_89314:327-953(+)
MLPLVPLVFDLVRADHQVQVIVLQEALSDVRAEGHDVAAAIRRVVPWRCSRVSPEEVGEKLAAWLALVPPACSNAVKPADLVQAYAWFARQTPVDDEHVPVHDVRQGQEVEQPLERCIRLVAVLRQDLPREAEGHVHLVGLVVSPAEPDVLGVGHLPGQQEEHGLHGHGPPVHKVPVEEVRILGSGPPIATYDAEEVEELAVDIPDDV